MDYIVDRTSGEEPPCEGAVKRPITLLRDIRCFDLIDEWKAKFPDDWNENVIESGVIEPGKCYRVHKVDEPDYFMWIVYVPDIREFVDKYGPVIVHKPPEHLPEFDTLYRIEIYDV